VPPNWFCWRGGRVWHSTCPRRQKIESYAEIRTVVIGRQSRHRIGVIKSTQAGIVERGVAAGIGDADVFDGAVAHDGEGGGGFDGARSASGGIDAGLVPVLRDAANHRGYVSGVAAGEVAATLSLEYGAAGLRVAWRLGIACLVFGSAAILVDSVGRRRRLVFDGGFTFDRPRLFDVTFGDFLDVFRKLGRLRLGRFILNAVRGVEHLAVFNSRRRGHRKSRDGAVCG